MKILFSADYGMGIGDFIVKLYAICHLNKYIKEKFNYYTILIIEEYQTNILDKLLNIDFFKEYFNEFIIQKVSGSYVQNLPHNDIIFNQENYYKQYSAINNYLENNGRGYWEFYTNNKTILPINYIDFDYRDPSTRKSQPIPDYNLPIFANIILDNAKEFTKNNLNKSFDCIYYRSLGDLNNNHLQDIVFKINTNIDPNKLIFLTSNSEIAKNYINNYIYNKCIIYKDINLSKTDGYGTAYTDKDRIFDLVTEMIIMAYADKIHYGGNHHYISLFTYYAHMIKQVPLIEY